MVGLIANFENHHQGKGVVELPYLQGVPEEVCLDIDGKILHHERVGTGKIIAFMTVFSKQIMKLSYKDCFMNGNVTVI